MNPTPAKPGSASPGSTSSPQASAQAKVYPRATAATPRPASGAAQAAPTPRTSSTARAAGTAPATAATVAPGAAPPAGGGAPAAPAATPQQLAAAARKKQMILIGAGVLAVLLLGVFVYWTFLRTVEAPRLNSEPYVIGKFTATSHFGRLPFEKKWQYYELMDDKEDALKAAYAEGKMNDDEYRLALQAAYYGKHLDRMKKYFEKPPGRERTAYLDKLVQKKYEDDDKKGDGKTSGKSDDLKPLTADEIKRDDTEQDDDISAWPADVRAKWEEYKREYKARKDLYKQNRDAEKARKNAPASKPVAVPTAAR